MESKAKQAVAAVRRAQQFRLVALENLHSFGSSPDLDEDDYEHLKDRDNETWQALKQARLHLGQVICDEFGENLLDLKQLCGY